MSCNREIPNMIGDRPERTSAGFRENVWRRWDACIPQHSWLKPLIWHVHDVRAPFFQDIASLPPDDLMQFTCDLWSLKLYCRRLQSVIAHVFLILPGEGDRCFSVTLWQRREKREKKKKKTKMCKSSLTLHQSALPSGHENITVFITVTTLERKEKKKALQSTAGRGFSAAEKTRARRWRMSHFISP